MTVSAGLERAIGLLDPARRPAAAAVPDGYLDLLGGAGRHSRSPAQRLMLTRGLPVVYERWWRPAWGRVLMGPLGPGGAGERRIAHELLELGPGDTVLDIACGPGNFVRDFAGSVGKRGLVVGLDASPTMLARAVHDTAASPNVAYVRGDAIRLPFRDASFDAVCCFAALHLFDEPLAALDAMARVLAPAAAWRSSRAPARRSRRRRSARSSAPRPGCACSGATRSRPRWPSAASRTSAAASPASRSSWARAGRQLRVGRRGGLTGGDRTAA